MNTPAYLREDIRWANNLLEIVTKDVTPEMAAWHPPGLANPIGATYPHAMYAASDAYLASLTDADLDEELDLSARGFGTTTVAWVLSALVISHLNLMSGEIAVLKGIQGAQGYPW